MSDPISIQQQENSNNSSIADEQSLNESPKSYESSYSSNSNFSDVVKNHNRVKRQGSRSSVLASISTIAKKNNSNNIGKKSNI